MVSKSGQSSMHGTRSRAETAVCSEISNRVHHARRTYGKFHPEYIICDAAYSSDRIRKVFKKQWHTQPIIKSRRKDRWIADETPEWQLIFNRRTAIERVFSRMKTQKRLNNVTVRRRRKVTVHSLLPVIVIQAVALAFPDTPRNCVV